MNFIYTANFNLLCRIYNKLVIENCVLEEEKVDLKNQLLQVDADWVHAKEQGRELNSQLELLQG